MEPGGSTGTILLLILLVALSAFFSATETAFSSVNHVRLKTMVKDGDRKTQKKARLALNLLDNYDRLLSSILIGNNIVNILSSSLAAVVFVNLLGSGGVSVSTAVMTIVILIFGEITPKTLAKDFAEEVTCGVAPFINAIVIVFTPLNKLFSLWRKLLDRIVPQAEQEADDDMTEEELLTIVEEAEQEGDLEKDESELIRSAIEFNDRDVEDILTHRVDIVALDVDMTLDEAEQVILENGFSRLPVYENNIDNIVGIIHEKDFFSMRREAASLREIMKEPYIVPPGTPISKLLRVLQSKKTQKTHMAIVKDEFGGTMGLVTLEDIIEQLVGKIYDEYDEVTELFRQEADGSWTIDCSASLEDMQENLGIDGEFDATTVGGWVLDQLEHFPKANETFTYENAFAVTVTEIEDTRVLTIRVRPIPPRAGSDEQDIDPDKTK